MRSRDKAILANLERFRCLSRDDIAAIHFSRNKASVKGCNEVMRRLRDRGEVEVISAASPFVYARKPSPLRKDSQKIPHYLAIVDVYRQMLRVSPPSIFVVEPRYGSKGMIEPDIFALWAGRAFWIEVQRNIFSSKVWAEKFTRYLDFFRSGTWRKEIWQPADRKVFPFVWILSETRVPVPDGLPFPVMQSRNVSELFANKKAT